MSGEARYISVYEDKETVRRLVRFFIAHHQGLFSVMVLVCLLTPLTGIGSGPDQHGTPRGALMTWSMLALVWWNAALVRKFNTMRTLPINPLDLGKALWWLTAFLPFALMTGSSLLAVLIWSSSEAAPGGFEEGIKQVLSYMAFLILLPAILGLACMIRSVRKLGYGQTLLSDNWMAVPMAAALVPMYYVLKDGSNWAGLVCWNLGAMGLVVSHLLREHLILDIRRREQAGQRKPLRLVAMPGRFSWPLSLLVLWRGELLFSTAVAAFTILIIGHAIAMGRADLSFELMMPVDCGVWGSFAVWYQWRSGLRAWRMLPLSRFGLAQAVATASLLCVVGPFTCGMALCAAVQHLNGVPAAQQCAFCAGIFMLLLGGTWGAMPIMLRGYWDTAGGRIVNCVLVLGGTALLLALLFLWDAWKLSQSMQTRSWAFLLAGCVALCLGGVASVWHANRVLRHGDCYRRANA